MKLQGGCLCGAMRYEIDGPLHEVGNCHREHFRWLSGQELMSVYETSPGIGWAFCRICGSSLGVPTDGQLSDLAIGLLDEDPGVRPTERPSHRGVP